MRVEITLHDGTRHHRAFADTAEGARLEVNAQDLGDDGALVRTAVYEPVDHATAPLFLVRNAPMAHVLDPAPRRRPHCPLCGLPQQREVPAGGYRVTSEAFQMFDLVRSHQEWLVSARLGERLRDRRGVQLHPVRGAPGYLLRWADSLGWPVDGTQWGEPCDTCGQRSGTTPSGWVAGVNAFARAAWQGDEAVGVGPMPCALVVCRGVRHLLEEPGWRLAGLTFQPVSLEVP